MSSEIYRFEKKTEKLTNSWNWAFHKWHTRTSIINITIVLDMSVMVSWWKTELIQFSGLKR